MFSLAAVVLLVFGVLVFTLGAVAFVTALRTTAEDRDVDSLLCALGFIVMIVGASLVVWPFINT